MRVVLVALTSIRESVGISKSSSADCIGINVVSKKEDYGLRGGGGSGGEYLLWYWHQQQGAARITGSGISDS